MNVLEVIAIDVRANMSRTGANRQKFYGIGAANRDVGKTKNLSTCTVVEA